MPDNCHPDGFFVGKIRFFTVYEKILEKLQNSYQLSGLEKRLYLWRSGLRKI
jgi:hypothetical protein